MKITLSKNQWENIGKQAGWIRSSSSSSIKIPYHEQEDSVSCGLACLRMALNAIGFNVNEDKLQELIDISENGVKNQNIYDFVKSLPLIAVQNTDSSKEDLSESIKNNYIVIVNFIDPESEEGHYSIVKEINDEEITLIDPDNGPCHKIKTDEFIDRWHGEFEKNKKWFCAIKKNK